MFQGGEHCKDDIHVNDMVGYALVCFSLGGGTHGSCDEACKPGEVIDKLMRSQKATAKHLGNMNISPDSKLTEVPGTVLN